MIKCFLIAVLFAVAGCIVNHKPSRDECDSLSRRYNANVIEITDFRTKRSHVHARLVNNRLMWKSSKSDVTKKVSATTIREARQLCAEQMRAGVEVNPNPPESDDWLSKGSL